MPDEIQAKGMQHIRNLKKVADELRKEFGSEPGMYIDCVEAALMEHRMKCLAEKRKRLSQTETGNPS